MLNARTWHFFCLSAFVLFPGTLLVLFAPAQSPLSYIESAMTLWGIIVGIAGALLGILFSMGRLKLGCPLCATGSTVRGVNSEGFYLHCPTCGERRMKLGSPFGLRPEILEPVEDEDGDEDDHQHAEEENILCSRPASNGGIAHHPACSSVDHRGVPH